MSTRIERNDAIAALENEFEGATGIYMTDFNGIDVEKITKIRNELRAVGSKYLVVKNTLAKIALERKGFEGLNDFIKGPTGIAVTREDAVGPAKVIKEFKKENADLLNLKVAYVDGSLFNADEAKMLADLPSKDVLLAQLLSVLNAPMSNFAASLSGVFTKFTGTLEAVIAKKESEA